MTLQDLEAQFLAFLDEAHRLKVKYAPQIPILVGLETEFVTDLDLSHLETILALQKDRIDYVVGSVHHVNEIPIDFDEPTFQKALISFERETDQQAQESLLCQYFEAQMELLRRIKPDIIGHIDLCRLYTPDIQLSAFPKVWELLERNIIYAVEYGALFEINAAAFRKNWDTAYPGPDVLGVRFFTLLESLLLQGYSSSFLNMVVDLFCRMIAMGLMLSV